MGYRYERDPNTMAIFPTIAFSIVYPRNKKEGIKQKRICLQYDKNTRKGIALVDPSFAIDKCDTKS